MAAGQTNSILSLRFFAYISTSGLGMLALGLFCICTFTLMVLKYSTKTSNEDSLRRFDHSITSKQSASNDVSEATIHQSKSLPFETFGFLWYSPVFSPLTTRLTRLVKLLERAARSINDNYVVGIICLPLALFYFVRMMAARFMAVSESDFHTVSIEILLFLCA